MAANVASEMNFTSEISYSSVTQCLNCNNLKEITEIEIIDNEITYEEFFLKFMCANRPCKFSSKFTDNWKSRKLWINNDDDKPNFDYLQREFGDSLAPVADCSIKLYNSHCKEDMSVKNYISYWKRRSYSKEDSPCLYLKDWHFVRQFPSYEAYLTPVYFISDWLNEFLICTSKNDDYRFVYMGPKDSWTPFHADVFGSYSWSANICGRKKWLLVPPEKEKVFSDSTGKLLFDIKLDSLNKLDVLEVIQEPGEIIFVPSGWHHQVWNLVCIDYV
ncbi:2-oxoglutarate and iron-dependent oxygenase JMJD4 [Centruroides vittatus]|uniref:2-oxoglutarate and iron-dependent oxygenase JMJD4 n=1 Tax=Centruroides vittatus TaxID=120091 RepID=UPI003510AC5B